MFDDNNRTSRCLFRKKLPIRKIFLIIEYRVAYSARNFANSSSSDVIKVRNARLPMLQIKRTIFIFVDKGNSGTKFGAPSITSSSSHFFN